MKTIICDVCGKTLYNKDKNCTITIEDLMKVEDCCEDCATSVINYIKSQHKQLFRLERN